MKLFAHIQNEKGKIGGIGGNKSLAVDISAGNRVIATFTVRENESGYYEVRDKDYRQLPVYCEKCRRWYGNDEVDPCNIPF
ncbi:MAG: hypothetical protein ACYDHY_19910 [Acidiferrobacterales bacterium]